MRRLAFFGVLLCMVSTAFSQQLKVAVYMTGSDPDNEIVLNRLMSDLKNDGRYKLFERVSDFLEAVSREHAYERSGEVDDDQIAALGKQFGVQYVVVGSMTQVWSSEKYISVHIIDVNSAEVIGSCSAFGTLDTTTSMVRMLDDLSLNFKKAKNLNKAKLKKVAVYAIKTGNRDVDLVMGDQIVSGFAKSGVFVAVERSNVFMKQLQREMSYQQSGAVDDNKRIAEIGRQLGVHYVCVTKTINKGGAYYITARLVDVETGEVSQIYNLENRKIEKTWDVVKVSQEIVDKFLDLSEDIINEEVSDSVFFTAEDEPEFPGGEAAMYRFISENIIYPAMAKENNIVGRVIVCFVVEKDGSITNIKILKDIGGGCADEVVRGIKLMPKWKAGRQRGKRVRVGYTLPVTFNLQ